VRLDDWLEEDSLRGMVDHVSFGDGWGSEFPMDSHSVAWSPLTGELYAVEHASRQVEVLAVVPDTDALKQLTDGWKEQQKGDGSLYWLRDRAARMLPPSLRDAEGADIPSQGRRYRVDLDDGRWWELGWDRPLGTYYAQLYAPGAPGGEDLPLDWKGTAFRELPDVADLEKATGLRVSHEVAVDLAVDKAWFPNEGRPPFLDAAEDFLRGHEPADRPWGADVDTDDGGRHDHPTRREAALLLWQHDLGQREAEVARKERQLASQLDATRGAAAVEPRWSLPPEPVIRLLNAQRQAMKSGLDAVADEFKLDREWARGVVTGEVAEVDLPHIAQVCEGFHCSPYDLWGKEDADTILHAYGPHLWPRMIEPLQQETGVDLGGPGVEL